MLHASTRFHGLLSFRNRITKCFSLSHTRFLTAQSESKQSILQTIQKSLRGTVVEALLRRLPSKEAKSLAIYFGVDKTSDLSSEILVDKSDIPASQQLPSIGGSGESAQATAATATAREQARIEKMLGSVTDKKDTPLYHPAFGELLQDLGYKRVYLTNVQALLKTPIWERQRILRPERAQRIAKYQLAKRAQVQSLGTGPVPPLGLPGVITMFHEVGSGSASGSGSGRFGIVDGQHRAAALVMLAQEGHWDSHVRNVVVDVFSVTSEEQVAELFLEINSAEPVRLVDMPGEGVTEDARAVLDRGTEALAAAYPDMFKASQRCRPPHLNTDVLRDELFQSQFLARHGVDSAAALEKALLLANERLSRLGDAEWAALLEREGGKGASKAKTFAPALKKAREHGLFLGLSKGWMCE